MRRAAGPAAISAAHRKWPAARPNNTFVPIPELGIYTPEQHVLQNGTYAQHCHLREVNNNNNNNNGSSNNQRRNTANGNSDGGGGGRFDNKPSSARTASSNNVANSAYVNNSNKQHQNNVNNNHNHNSSFNSSFDESVSSYGYAPVKGVLRGYDPTAAAGVQASGNSRYPSGDVYHSCVDISHTYRNGGQEEEFNTLSSRRSYDVPGYAPIREEEAGLVRGRPRSPEQPNRRRGEKDSRAAGYRQSEDEADDDAAKMDSGARSFSLGDLSAGLTFSLAPQQKSGSVTAVNGSGGRKGRGLSSPGLAPKTVRPAPSAASISSSDREEGSSALRHIRERLQKAVFKSQDKRNGGSSNQQTAQTSRAPQGRDTDSGHHYQRRGDNRQPPHPQRQRQDQLHADSQRATYHSSYQRQISAPEGTQILMSSPRNRRDSEETTSSYRSAHSDTSHYGSSHQNLPISSSATHNTVHDRTNRTNNLGGGNNNISNSSNSISSTLNNTDSSGNSFATAKSTSTITNNTDVSSAPNANCQVPSNRDQSAASPSKPKRSLPNVPLSETSERIKRFTEMMKSRMSSTGSRAGSSNGSRSGSSAKHTPTQRSTDSACSHTSLSRKSSMETASDSEVFTINNGAAGVNNVRVPQHGGSAAGNPKQHQPQHHHHHPQNNILPNQYPDFQERKNHNHAPHATSNFTGARHEDLHAPIPKGYTGHGQGQSGHRPLTSEDTPLPPGDRSTDSGQTTGTNQSYTGSAMDSGYTTNNDADNDSFNTNNQQQQQQQQHLQHHHQHFQSLEPHHQQRHQHQEYSRHQHYHPHPQHQPPPPSHPTSAISPHHLTNHHQYSSSSSSKPHTARTVNGYGHAPAALSDNEFEDFHRPQIKHNSNLANAHRFGSVQNVSSAQAHGTPRDSDLLPVNESTPNWHRQQQLSQAQRRDAGALSAREYSSKLNYEKNQPNLQGRGQNSGGRRSWDFADARLDNDRSGVNYFQDSNLKKYDRRAPHYKSTEVISSSKPLFTDSNYVNANHIPSNAYQNNHNGNNGVNKGKPALTLQEQSQAIAAKFRTMQFSNGPDVMSHSYHGGLVNPASHSNGYTTNGWGSHSSSSTSQNKFGNNPQPYRTNGNITLPPQSQRQQQYQQHQNGGGGHQQAHDRHQLHPPHSQQHHQQQQPSQTNGNSTGGEVVKLRPVPMSRANRNARGRTLPGGFRFTDAEIAAAGGASGDGKTSVHNAQASQQDKDQGQEVMLFHLTQKFDLCPLLVNLPRHVSLKDLAELSEFQVEISLVGVPGAAGGSPLGGPSSPQGPVASKIGSPGSAFTPVRNSQDFEGNGGGGGGAGADSAGKVMNAKVKVIRFSRVWGEELQRHTTLGRLLEGDIVVEVRKSQVSEVGVLYSGDSGGFGGGGGVKG